MEQVSVDGHQDNSVGDIVMDELEDTNEQDRPQILKSTKAVNFQSDSQCDTREKVNAIPSNGFIAADIVEHNLCNSENVTVLNTLPEEIREELNRHAEYHLLKSASNQVPTAEEGNDQENPLSSNRNPVMVSVGEETGNPISQQDASYVGTEIHEQHDPSRNNYFGSDSSSFNILDATPNLGHFSENHIIEEVALPTELNDLGIDDDYLKGIVETEGQNKKVFYKLPLNNFDLKQKSVKDIFTINKVSNKSTTLLDSSSISKIKKMWAKTSPIPKPSDKKGSIKKQNPNEPNSNKVKFRKSEKLSKNAQLETSQKGKLNLKRDKRETSQKGKLNLKKAISEKDILSKFGIAPCSVKLFRLKQDKQVTKEKSCIKEKNKKVNNVKEQKCKEFIETQEQSFSESTDNLFSSGIVSDDQPEDNEDMKVWEQDDFDINDIPGDIESDHSLSEDEYTPNKNENFGKVFLKNTKSRKPKKGKNKSVTRKIEFNMADLVPEKPAKRPFHPTGYHRIGRPPVFGHFECRKCDFTANEKNLVEKHNKKVHPTEWMSCRYCERSFKVYDCLLEHEAVKHTKEKIFSCSFDGCDYSSTNRTDLSRHQAKHATEKTYSCKLCGWMTKWRKNLRTHHLMRHTSQKNFKCKLCDYECKRNSDLKQHMFRHTSDKPIQCLTCGFCVKTNWELKSHMLTHSTEKPFKCQHPGCPAATKTNSDLLKHMRQVHKEERDCVCKLCNKGFKNKQGLHKHHEYVHEKKRPFTCEICNRAFKCRGNLRKHLLTHTNFKPYQCSVCKKCFSINTNLRKHMETHDFSQRPFRCPLCPYGAKKSDHLLSHIGAYHGDKYCYFCEFCKKPFKRHQRLRLHYELMHKTELSQLKYGEHADMALIKMELDLLEEDAKRKKTGKRGKGKKTKAKKSEKQPEITIKQEPIDDEYEQARNTNVDRSANEIEMMEKQQRTVESSMDIVGDLIGEIIDAVISQGNTTDDVEMVNKSVDELIDDNTADKMNGEQDNTIDITTTSCIPNGTRENIEEENNTTDIANEEQDMIKDMDKTNDMSTGAQDNIRNENKTNETLNGSQDKIKDTSDLLKGMEGSMGNKNDTNDILNGAQDNNEDGSVQKTHESTDIEIIGTSTEEVIEIEDNNDHENTDSSYNSNQIHQSQDDTNTLFDHEVFPGFVIKAHPDSIPDSTGNLPEGTLNFTESKNATVAVYTNLRIPLATKGFQFNYEKNGKKPNAWFMDASLMNEKDASKFKKYLRSKGVLPPLPKGKKRKHTLTNFLKKRTVVRNQTILKSKIMKSSKKEPREGLKRQARFKGKYSESEIESCDTLFEDINILVPRVKPVRAKPSETHLNDVKPLKLKIMKCDYEMKNNQNSKDPQENKRLVEGKRKRKPTKAFDIGIEDQQKKCKKNVKSKGQHKNTQTSKVEQAVSSVKESKSLMTGKKSKSVETMFPSRWTKKYIPVKQRKANAKKGEISGQIDGPSHKNKTKSLEKSNSKTPSPKKMKNKTQPTIDFDNVQEEDNIIWQSPEVEEPQNYCSQVIVFENGSFDNNCLEDSYVNHQVNISESLATVNSNEPVRPICLIENQKFISYEVNSGLDEVIEDQNIKESHEYSVSVNRDIKVELSDYGLKMEPVE